MDSLKKFGKPLMPILFRMGCLIGFMIQSREVCLMYFQFETTTYIEMTMPDQIPVPHMTFCMRYLEILDRSNGSLMSGFGGNIDLSTLTIKQIFDLTPTGEDTIHACYIRSNDTYTMNVFNRSDCLSHVNVTKFYMQEFMCYMYFLKEQPTYSMFDVANSIDWPSMYFTVVTNNQHLLKTCFGMVIVSTGEDRSLPLDSRYLGKFIRMCRRPGVFLFNRFYVYYKLSNLYSLPPPYQSKCTNDEDEDKYICRKHCLIEGMKSIDRFPSSEMTTDSTIDVKHTNPADFKNSSMVKIIDDVTRRCKAKCMATFCRLHYAGTRLNAYHSDVQEGQETIDMNLMIPDSDTTTISIRGKMTLIEFVVYIGSSLGVWFGISIASLNPAAFNRKYLFKTRIAPRTGVVTNSNIIRNQPPTVST